MTNQRTDLVPVEQETRVVYVQDMTILDIDPDRPLPVSTWDDADQPNLFYYAPVNHKALGITADYVYVTGNTRYIIYGNWAFTGPSGEGNGKFPPPRVLYGQVNHKVTRRAELWFKFSGMNTEKSGPRFGDYVAGINARF